MKKVNQFIIMLSLLFVVFAFSAKAQITQISQVKDVKSSDQYFHALKSMIERYGVFNEEKFRANDPLTREEFAVLLNKGLDMLEELSFSIDKNISIFDFFNSYSANETNITSFSQIKDINDRYSQYVHLESLTEKYQIDILDKDFYFRPTKTVTEKELYTWVAKIFNGSINSSPSATKAIDRGEWIIVMEAALSSVYERINNLATKRK